MADVLEVVATPMRLALALAWESARAGSLGIGSVVTDATQSVVATGRNRLGETHGEEDLLAGTSVAHAELNALAKLRWRAYRDDHLTLWTTLEPCLQCAGAIRLAPISEVVVLAPDPLFPEIDQVRAITDHMARQWPAWHRCPVTELTVFALLLEAHSFLSLAIAAPEWVSALPRIAALAKSLFDTHELRDLAANNASLDEVLQHLWPRLGAGIAETEALHRR